MSNPKCSATIDYKIGKFNRRQAIPELGGIMHLVSEMNYDPPIQDVTAF
jgi:hypothetical protein